MCIFAISVNNHPEYKLIAASNRDEFFNRKTKFAHYWKNEEIIAGKDLEKGGTWFGLHSKHKKIAILTNYRNPKLVNPDYKSRGMLVVDFLTQNISIDRWRAYPPPKTEASRLYTPPKRGAIYNPFNIISGDFDNLYYYNNINNELIKLKKGIHILSNGFLNEPWPKAEKLRKLFTKAIKNDFKHSDLIKIMKDEEKFPLNQLPYTNISTEMEYFLSSIFINSKTYGTRATTILTIDYQNKIKYTEISYNNKKEIISDIRLG